MNAKQRKRNRLNAMALKIIRTAHQKEQLRAWSLSMVASDDFDDVPACAYCGAIAGACPSYPNCPNGPKAPNGLQIADGHDGQRSVEQHRHAGADDA